MEKFHAKLAGRMASMKKTNREMATELGISEVSFCNKKLGKVEFKPSEWKTIACVLDIPNDEIGEYILEC